MQPARRVVGLAVNVHIYSDSKVAVSRGGVEQAFMPAIKRHRKYRPSATAV